MAAPWDYPPDVAADPVVARVRRLAADVLAPSASAVAAGSVQRPRIDLVAATGALGLPLARPVARTVEEVLGGACGATAFVVAQHARPAGLLRHHLATAPDGELAALARAVGRGEVLATTAFTHLRRPGAPQVVARRTGRGWRIDGRIDWVSSWGLADVLHLAAVTPDDEVVSVLVPANDGPGIRAGSPMSLLAMTATRTVAVDLDGLAVADSHVLDRTPRQAWAAADADAVADARPGAFGLLGAVIDGLGRSAPAGSAQAELAASSALTAAALREECYHFADQPDRASQRDHRLHLRARQLTLLNRVGTALVVAGGGRATVVGADAERMAREALFHLVSGQTADVRTVTLEALTPA